MGAFRDCLGLEMVQDDGTLRMLRGGFRLEPKGKVEGVGQEEFVLFSASDGVGTSGLDSFGSVCGMPRSSMLFSGDEDMVLLILQ